VYVPTGGQHAAKEAALPKKHMCTDRAI
jgi:hypothetical protein